MTTTQKMMEQMMNQMSEITSSVKSLDERLTKLEKGGSGKQTSKKSATKVSATKTSSKKKSNDSFDRSLYEAKAKELGCFNHGVVVATVENGVIVRSRKQNRDLVYKAMGLK